jgi:hypothetical protein
MCQPPIRSGICISPSKMPWAGLTTTSMNFVSCRLPVAVPCASAFRTMIPSLGTSRSFPGGRSPSRGTCPLGTTARPTTMISATTGSTQSWWKGFCLPFREPRTRRASPVGGKCPPEDVGGVSGYEEFLEALRDPYHEEHESYLTWVGGSYDPGDFDPKAVRFDDPERRWRVAFLNEEEHEE